MWYYGKATTDMEAEGRFATREDALSFVRDESMYRDDVLQVWSDDGSDTAECLVWGGTVYSA
jgi:hypothetical protein